LSSLRELAVARANQRAGQLRDSKDSRNRRGTTPSLQASAQTSKVFVHSLLGLAASVWSSSPSSPPTR